MFVFEPGPDGGRAGDDGKKSPSKSALYTNVPSMALFSMTVRAQSFCRPVEYNGISAPVDSLMADTNTSKPPAGVDAQRGDDLGRSGLLSLHISLKSDPGNNVDSRSSKLTVGATSNGASSTVRTTGGNSDSVKDKTGDK